MKRTRRADGADESAEGSVDGAPSSTAVEGPPKKKSALKGKLILTKAELKEPFWEVLQDKTAQMAMESFRVRLGLGQETEAPLELVERLGVRRPAAHRSFLESVRGELLEVIKTMDEAKRVQLLRQALSHLTNEELRAVPMALLNHLHKVPDDLLWQLAAMQAKDPANFETLNLPPKIKQAIWETSPALFKDVAATCLDAYSADETFSKMRRMAVAEPKTLTPVRTLGRRKLFDATLKDIVATTGTSEKLLSFVCDAIAERFAAACGAADRSAAAADALLWCTMLTDVLIAAGKREEGRLDDLRDLAVILDGSVGGKAEEVFGRLALAQSLVQRVAASRLQLGGCSANAETAAADKTASATAAASAAVAAAKEAAAAAAKSDDESDDGGGEGSIDSGLGGAADPNGIKLQAALLEAWQALGQADGETHIFEVSVDPKYAPRYQEIVKRPMDLGTMSTKVQAKQYPSLSALVEDAKLMFDNCRAYNAAETSYHREAVRQALVFEGWLADYKKRAKAAAKEAAAGKRGTRSTRRVFSAGSTADGQGARGKKRGGGGSSGNDNPGALRPLPAQLGLGPMAGMAAMLLAEPFFEKRIYWQMRVAVAECVDRGVMPIKHPALPGLVQLATLGAAAADMRRLGIYGVPAPSGRLLHCGLPMVVLLLSRARWAPAGGSDGGDGGSDGDGETAVKLAVATLVAKAAAAAASFGAPAPTAAEFVVMRWLQFLPQPPVVAAKGGRGGAPDEDDFDGIVRRASRLVLLRLLVRELLAHLPTAAAAGKATEAAARAAAGGSAGSARSSAGSAVAASEEAAVAALAAAAAQGARAAPNELFWPALRRARDASTLLGDDARNALERLVEETTAEGPVMKASRKAAAAADSAAAAPPAASEQARKKRREGIGNGKQEDHEG